MAQPSLNPISPEQITHGSTIVVQANGITLAEITSIQFDEDPHMEALHFLGSKRISRKPGLTEIKGTIKGYLVNQVARSLWMGLGTPTVTGGGSTIYHSTRSATRYNIAITSNDPLAQLPPETLINVTFSKDTLTWDANKLTLEDIAFEAEDILGA